VTRPDPRPGAPGPGSPLSLELWSDVVCPWCYVGRSRLVRAVAASTAAGAVQLTHRAFQLDPRAPRDRTRSRREMLMAKYRLPEAEVQAMDARMAATAAAEGLAYQVTDGRTGNTFDAHRLLHMAAAHDRHDALLDRMYVAYFAEGRSLFDHDSLADLAGEAGLKAPDVRAVLDTDAYAAEVEADQARARTLGLSGVPFLLVDGREGVSGAQPHDVFRAVIDRAWAARQAASPGG
jgi:predicted DsbA family dithiol-disulfide isomerase